MRVHLYTRSEVCRVKHACGHKLLLLTTLALLLLSVSRRGSLPYHHLQQRTVIFCTTQFSYLKNRENCIHDFTGGPLLA